MWGADWIKKEIKEKKKLLSFGFPVYISLILLCPDLPLQRGRIQFVFSGLRDGNLLFVCPCGIGDCYNWWKKPSMVLEGGIGWFEDIYCSNS